MIPRQNLVFKIKADFLKSLAHPTRLEIIEYLKSRESSVGELVKELGAEQSGLSKHLAVLRQAGIVSARQQGVTVYYSVRDKDIFRVLRPIAEILRKNLLDGQKLLSRLGRV